MTTAVSGVWLSAVGAMAQTYPPEPSTTTSVLGAGGSDAGSSTAFTGGDLTGVVIVAAVLLALGLITLFVAKRRTA